MNNYGRFFNRGNDNLLTRDKNESIIKRIILSVTLVILLFYAVFFLLAPKDITKYLGFGVFRITSDSMVPVINVNDTVIVVNANAENLQKGDIIVFNTYSYNEKIRVTHYFSHIDEQGCIITYRLDAKNPEVQIKDRWFKDGKAHYIKSEAIVGKVTAKLPTSAIFNFLFSKIGMLFIAFMSLSAYFLSKYTEESKKSVYDK